MSAADSALAPSGPGDPALAHLLAEALSELERWAPRRLAVILSGSAAKGEMVWACHDGRRVTLSDLDLYVVTSGPGDRDEARRRAREGLAAARARARRAGLEAPLEVAFFTPLDLQALPARPATLELRRSARVVEGEARWLERVPDWRPQDIGREERLLLLENRGFELLWALPRLADAGLDALRARHAVLKVALDVAGARCLAAGAYPERAAERVALAGGVGGAAPDAALESAWRAGLAWRSGSVDRLAAAPAAAEWRVVARAWRDAWADAAGDADPDRPASVAVHARHRAPLHRRVRRSIQHRDRSGRGPGLAQRLAHAGAGTPQHRVHATGVILLAASSRVLDAGGGVGQATDIAVREALEGLGVITPRRSEPLAQLAARAVRAWDDWLLDGQRAGTAS